MDANDLNRQLRGRMTRRTVVATGAKLAYAAPIVAASFSLLADGALAAVCPAGYTATGLAGPQCCKCPATTVIGRPRPTPVVVGGQVLCSGYPGGTVVNLSTNPTVRGKYCTATVQSRP